MKEEKSTNQCNSNQNFLDKKRRFCHSYWTMVRSTKKNSIASGIASVLSAITMTKVLYAALLLSFLANGYLFARVQTGGTVTNTLGSSNDTAPLGQDALQQQPQDRDNVKVETGHLPPLGDENAPVTLIEFSDFQCPFCRSFYTGAFQQLKKDYIDTGKVKFYYRHFPLPATLHPMAVASGIASECANEQGKFWEYHDKMFDEQQKQGNQTITYTNDDLKKWAADLGLNTGQFDTCLDSEKYKDQVNKDLNDGSAIGVNSTPSFYINGRELIGAQPYETFKQVIDQKLAE